MVSRFFGAALFFAVLLLGVRPAGAQATFSTLYTFSPLSSPSETNADGSQPGDLALGTDGNFYGATHYGGANANGTIFRITPDGILTTLHTFDASDSQGHNHEGRGPDFHLMLGTDGNFYGATTAGGANGTGTLFKITPTGAFTLLHTFDALDSNHNNHDGANPSTGLVEGRDGNYYGNAAEGGAHGSGTIYQVTSNGAFTLLYTFSTYNSSNTDGAQPCDTLVQGQDGNFYGCTLLGGNATNNDGTLFRMTPGGALTILHAFSFAEGYSPSALFQAVDGNFYGVDSNGGLNDTGTLFRVNASGGDYTTLYNFTATHGSTNMDGAFPFGSLIQGTDGALYGTCRIGGAGGKGTLYKFDLTMLRLTTFHSLAADSSEGDQPAFGLTFDSSGALYGTTLSSSNNGSGTVFRLGPKIIYTWQAVSDSVGPDGNTRLLWDFVGGVSALWIVNPQGTIISAPHFGPFPTWRATAVSVGPDNNAHVLWNKSDGTAALWTVTPAGAIVAALQFGPFPGWAAIGLAAAPDGNTRLLWDRNDGLAALWTVNPAGAIVNAPQFGPFSGWAATALAVGADSNTHLLWDESNGTAALWTLNTVGTILSAPQFGPLATWAATAVSVGADGNARLLWNKSDGTAALWTITSAGTILNAPQYGPFAHWRPVSLSVGSDNNAHLLWDQADGTAALWTLNPAGAITNAPQYGPYH